MFRRSQKCIVSVLLLIMGQLIASAQLYVATPGGTNSGVSVAMAWDPSPDANVAGYYIYYGTISGQCTNRLDAGPTATATVSGMEVGMTYYFTVTAYDEIGQESPPSNEIAFTVPDPIPDTPITLQFKHNASGTTIAFQAASAGSYEIQATQDFHNWTTIWTTNATAGTITVPIADGTNYSHRFYRMVKN